MGQTNVPLPTFGPAGLITASEEAIINGVMADYVAAFAAGGRTLNPSLTTPQGQLASSQSYMVEAFQAKLAQLIAQVDPATASGAYQDALGRIYFMTRKGATFATAAAVVQGAANATLAGPMQARSPDGTVWASPAVTFNNSGQATVAFTAATAGSAPTCAADELTVYQQQSGWAGFLSNAACVPGLDVENRQSFEARRAESVTIGGRGQAANIRAAVLAVPGVTDCFVYDNKSPLPFAYGATNYPIPGNSVAISVAGSASPLAIAEAINSKLDCGAGMSGHGTTLVNWQDTVNYGVPYPTYPIRYIAPPAEQLFMTVNVANLSTLPSDYVAQVKSAVFQAFLAGWSSMDGSIVVPRARIGAQIIAAVFEAPILALGAITPVSAFIGTSAAPTSGTSFTLGIDQQPVLLQENINVVAVNV